MKPKAVLWDMDGVLVDTGEYHYQAWSTVMPQYEQPFTRKFFAETFGMNNAGVLGTLMGDRLTPELLAEISDRKEEAFRAAVRGNAEPLPGVLDWLRRLQASGFRQGVASSAPPANIEALVGELGLANYFDAIVSGSDLPGKPEPDLFLKVAHLLDTPTNHCIVIEDAVAGVEAAKRAGIKCVAVTTTNPAGALEAADMVVDSLTDLAEDAFERLLDGPDWATT
jgi:beta-phosphoglucomutase family hydrolase